MRAKISIILKLICIGAVIYGCFTISEGLRTFTKFTTLSNLGIGIAVLLILLHEIKLKKDTLLNPSQGKYIFKFVMTVAILITFIIFLTVLAPTNSKGFIGAYLNNYCGSMAHHFIAPITAIIDFFVFDRNYQPKLAHAFCSSNRGMCTRTALSISMVIAVVSRFGFFVSIILTGIVFKYMARNSA